LADTAASHNNLPCRKFSQVREFNMPSISSAPSSVPWHARARRRRRDHADAGLVCPLVFSLTGLVTHGLALMAPGEDGSLTLLGFALIAGAPPIAAMAALHFAGNSDEPYS
jgi:hypothetical protein